MTHTAKIERPQKHVAEPGDAHFFHPLRHTDGSETKRCRYCSRFEHEHPGPAEKSAQQLADEYAEKCRKANIYPAPETAAERDRLSELLNRAGDALDLTTSELQKAVEEKQKIRQQCDELLEALKQAVHAYGELTDWAKEYERKNWNAAISKCEKLLQ